MKTEKVTLFEYCNFLVLLSTTVCSQNINKQNVNIADETLTVYSFLSRYHYTKSKNYFQKTISNSSLNSHVYWDTLYNDLVFNFKFTVYIVFSIQVYSVQMFLVFRFTMYNVFCSLLFNLDNSYDFISNFRKG